MGSINREGCSTRFPLGMRPADLALEYRSVTTVVHDLRHVDSFAIDLPIAPRNDGAIRRRLRRLFDDQIHGVLWEKWVGNGLSLDGGIAAVVARSNNALSPDSVYLIVKQTAQPTTYRTVVSWSDREIDREGIDVPQIMNNGRH